MLLHHDGHCKFVSITIEDLWNNVRDGRYTKISQELFNLLEKNLKMKQKWCFVFND